MLTGWSECNSFASSTNYAEDLWEWLDLGGNSECVRSNYLGGLNEYRYQDPDNYPRKSFEALPSAV